MLDRRGSPSRRRQSRRLLGLARGVADGLGGRLVVEARAAHEVDGGGADLPDDTLTEGCPSARGRGWPWRPPAARGSITVRRSLRASSTPPSARTASARSRIASAISGGSDSPRRSPGSCRAQHATLRTARSICAAALGVEVDLVAGAAADGREAGGLAADDDGVVEAAPSSSIARARRSACSAASRSRSASGAARRPRASRRAPGEDRAGRAADERERVGGQEQGADHERDRPPASASKNRSKTKPEPGGWIVTTSTAEIPAWLTMIGSGAEQDRRGDREAHDDPERDRPVARGQDEQVGHQDPDRHAEGELEARVRASRR